MGSDVVTWACMAIGYLAGVGAGVTFGCWLMRRAR